MAPTYRYRATIEYDGTDFLGYQVQARGRTVQGEIERAIEKVTQSFVRIDAAGRTDAGVHATGQVIAFTVVWKHTLSDLHRALNVTLPTDIIISDLKIVNNNFHPRFGALQRSYRYTIINQAWPSVLQRRYAYHVKPSLNVPAMQAASQQLIGTYDFASFGKPPQGVNTVRHILQANWQAQNACLYFDITANAFLYRMVRTIVGTLVWVGLGRLAIADIEAILQARDLTRSAPPAPACGLCLVSVAYPDEGVSLLE